MEQVDVEQIRKPFALFQWVGMNALAIYALAAWDIFTAVVQGFYWRLPENNLVVFLLLGLLVFLVLCDIWAIYISFLEFLALCLSDMMFQFTWYVTNNIVHFPFQDFRAAIVCALVYRYNTQHDSYSKHNLRRKWWGDKALQHLGFSLIQSFDFRGGTYILT